MTFEQENFFIKIIRDIAKRKNVSIHLVGGFLRDHALGSNGYDFDFAVEKKALEIARLFAQKIKGAYILLDAERGCARVAKRKQGRIMTFDFSDFRAKTFRQDLNLRDFTINTLSVDLFQWDPDHKIEGVLKNFKSALKDLREKRIKMVSPKAFDDDPLRMLRAFSLKATLSFKIERRTLDQIKKKKHLIREVSYERIRDELFKILETDQAINELKTMARIGLLENIIPQIRVMYRCKQGAYHHLEVWPHSLQTVWEAEKIYLDVKKNPEIADYFEEKLGGQRTRKALWKLAALLHDIGKPDARRKKDGKFYFYGHERVGQHIVRHVSKMLKLSTRERHILEDMVRWHLRPGYLSNFRKPTERAIYRYFRDTKDEALSILLLSLADQRSTRGPLTTENDQRHHEKICLKLVKQYFDKKKEKPFTRFINGDDLIKTLKLQPSPLFGKILSEVEEKQILGKIKTKKEALVLAKEIVLKKR